MNLKELARSRGTNLKKIAEEYDIPASTLYAISSGETNFDNVGIGLFIKLATALDIDPDNLYKLDMSQPISEEVLDSLVKTAIKFSSTHGFEGVVENAQFSKEEQELTSLYRRMSETDRETLLNTARRFAEIATEMESE